MIASYPTRHFQLWEYKVSHGSLLVRSPRKPTIQTNIDIIFVGVEFIGTPRHFNGIDLMQGTQDDVKSAGATLGREVQAEQVFVLISEGSRYFVVATACKLDENEGDIFDSPFS